MNKSFEDLDVWRRAKTLAVDVCRKASVCKDWGFRDQIMRSSVSVPSNIAEGAERNGRKEFVQFLGIARGSLGELRTQIMIGAELDYFRAEECEGWIADSRELSRMLHGLIRSLREANDS